MAYTSSSGTGQKILSISCFIKKPSTICQTTRVIFLQQRQNYRYPPDGTRFQKRLTNCTCRNFSSADFSVTPAKTKMSESDSTIHLFAALQPFNSGLLEVSDIHKIYYEESGNKNGVPVLFVHGGPGGGCGDRDRRYFDPEAYRIILFDQRGAGKSIPAFSLEENDTWSLVADIEKLREHLGIEKWVVFGGSWGSTLALVYAETHISRVMALILRGIFTLRKEELAWFYQEGASYMFPDFWEEYVAPIPQEERGDFIKAYYKRLTGDNEEERLRCARTWSKWEMATSQLCVNQDNLNRCADDAFSLAFARIECHYFINNGFFKTPNHVLDNAKIIHDSGIPVTIVQGRYDVVCPAKTAWELHKQLPNAEFHLIEDAGHSAKEESITKRLVEACEKYKTLFTPA